MTPTKSNNRSLSVGIDLLALDRLRSVKKNPHAWKRLLTGRESNEWKKSRYSIKRLAFFLTAKEAAFKASGMVWMGPHQFSAFEVVSVRGKSFEIRQIGSNRLLKGSSFSLPGYAGAQVLSEQN